MKLVVVHIGPYIWDHQARMFKERVGSNTYKMFHLSDNSLTHYHSSMTPVFAAKKEKLGIKFKEYLNHAGITVLSVQNSNTELKHHFAYKFIIDSESVALIRLLEFNGYSVFTI
jgi:hypothetical protein